MIQLLFLVLFAEAAVTVLLMVKVGVLRELVMVALDQMKMGKGPATLKTLVCTMLVIFVSSIASIVKMQNKSMGLGTVTPVDQVLWRTHLLEASLIGYILFLALVIDRLHLYLRKLTDLKKANATSNEVVEILEKENHSYKRKEEESSNEINRLHEEVSNLTEKLQKIKLESDMLQKRAFSAEEHVSALQRQSEELLLEYDRLLAENQILQGRALSFRR